MTINRENLDQVFNMGEVIDIPTTPPAVIEPPPPVPPEEDSPRFHLLNSIDRANRYLDQIDQEIMQGGLTPRILEVAALLLRSINESSSMLNDRINHTEFMEVKHKMIELKEREIEIKAKLSQQMGASTPGGVSERLIITDRESLLKFIQDKGTKQITSNKERMETNDAE